MKKLLIKDKKLRLKNLELENRHFVLKSIFKNLNFFMLIRWNSFVKIKNLSSNGSKISTTPRCLYTMNKKRFNKLTNFSRYTFFKLLRSGDVSGIQKSSW
jgi:ribosomal protein S14